MIVDIVIKNCKIVRPEGISSEGIAVDGEKVAAIANYGHLPEAKRVIDAKGNHVIPGVMYDSGGRWGKPRERHILRRAARTTPPGEGGAAQCAQLAQDRKYGENTLSTR